jgi:hypothetical protein
MKDELSVSFASKAATTCMHPLGPARFVGKESRRGTNPGLDLFDHVPSPNPH